MGKNSKYPIFKVFSVNGWQMFYISHKFLPLRMGKNKEAFFWRFLHIGFYIFRPLSCKRTKMLQLFLSIHKSCKYESLFCVCLSVVIGSICYHSVQVLNKEKVICYRQSFHIVKVFQKLHSLGFILKATKNMNRPKRPCYYCGLLQSQIWKRKTMHTKRKKTYQK